MASNLAGLAKNIEESISSLGSIFSKNPPNGPGAYPGNENSFAGTGTEVKKVLNEINPGNWTKSLPYTFSVQNSPKVLDAQGKSRLGFTDFPLPINPSEIQQDENFSIKITPTQGGSVINRGGNKYGDLVISGTTGVHPNRGAGGASKRTGKANFQPNDLNHRSGYEVFLRLRNWFKAYHQIKAIAKTKEVQEARLVFKNFKDGEFLVVELLKFTMKRSAGRAFLYDYNLQFKILGRVKFEPSKGAGGFFEQLDNVMDTALDALDTARGVFLRSQDLLRQIESTYENTVLEPMRKATLAAKAFTGIGTVAADMSRQAISNTVSSASALAIALKLQKSKNDSKVSSSVDSRLASVKLPNNLQQAASVQGSGLILGLGKQSDVLMAVDSSAFPAETLDVLASEQADTLELPRSFYEDAIEEISRVRDNAVDAFNLGSSVYNEQFDRVVSSKADPSKQVTDREYELLAGFEKALEAFNLLLSTNALFKAPYDQRIANVKNGFSDNLPDVIAEQAVKQVTMPQDMDLERLALIELGSAARWIEIAEVNNLKPPYVVQDQSDYVPNTVHPGDKILIPQPLINGFGDTETVKERYINKDMNAVERNLGIDLKINKDFDLIFTNKGDVEVVKGAENAAQAVILKLSIDKGELLDHPEIGVGLTVGTKVPDVSEIQTKLFQTLSADPRFDGVEDVEIFRQSGTLNIKFMLRVKNVDSPIPVSLKL